MNLVKSLIMAVILLLGGLYVWRYEMGPGKKDASSEEFTQLLPGIAANNLQRVEVSYGAESYGIERNAQGRWLMMQPPGAATDQHNVEDILQSIVEAKVYNTIEKADVQEDTAIYGLKLPELTVSILDVANVGGVAPDGSAPRQIFFGKKHSFSSRRYVRITGDDRLFLVGNETFESLRKERSEVRDRRPFDFDESKVERLILERSGEAPLKFTKEDDGKWYGLAGDYKFRADGQLLQRCLADVAQLMVKEFIDAPSADLGRYGISEPRLKITAESRVEQGAQSVSYSIGEVTKLKGKTDAGEYREEGLFIKRSDAPIVYRFEKRFYGDLLQPLDHFRAKDVFATLNPADVSKIAVDDGEAHFALVRRDVSGKQVWQLERGVGIAVDTDQGKIEKLLATLRDLRILSYPMLGPDKESRLGFDRPAFKISLYAGREELNEPLYSVTIGDEVLPAENDATGASPVNNQRVVASNADRTQPPSYVQLNGIDGKDSVAIVSFAVIKELKQTASYFEQNK